MGSVTPAREKKRSGLYVIINWSDMLTAKNSLVSNHQLKEINMKTELELALAELINKANNGIDSATGFLQAEIPDVIEQLLLWHGVYNFTMFLCSILILSSLYWQARFFFGKIPAMPTEENKAGNWFYERYHGGSSIPTIRGVGYSVSLCIFLIVEIIIAFYCLNLIWLQIWIAPKVWLLEYAAKLGGN